MRYDLNDYSVPHTCVRKTLTVIGKTVEVIILDGESIVATHKRSYDKSQQIEDPLHIQVLVERKEAARDQRNCDQLIAALPVAKAFLIEAANRGYTLGSMKRNLTKLLESYGATLLNRAMEEAYQKGVPHLNAVRQALDRFIEEDVPRVSIHLQDQKMQQLSVRPHDLALYQPVNQEKNA